MLHQTFVDCIITHTALEGLAQGTQTAGEVVTTLDRILPPSSAVLAGQGATGSRDIENPMHTFLHMSEDEFASALERAMDRKGISNLTVLGT